MPPEDIVRLQHMLDAAETAIDFMQGRDRSALEHDRMLLFAPGEPLHPCGIASSMAISTSTERSCG